MARSVLLLLAGAVTGGAAVWLLPSLSTRESASPLPSLPETVAPSLPATATSPVDAPVGYAAERVAIYEQATRATDAEQIETLIELALDEPNSRLRELRLTTLLARFSELDPRAAIEFARTRYLDPELLVPLFESWARSDPDAAIDELALITPPARQREIALAMLAVIGNDDDAIERVAAALPAASRASFEIDSWLARAEADPAGALRELLAMPRDQRQSVLLPRLARLAAANDPVGAIALAASISDYAQRRSFRDTVITTWAGNDPEAVFAWLETAAIKDLPESTQVYQALATSDSDRLFEMVEALPPAIRTNAERAAMQALAETNAMAALARLESMPPGQARDSLLTTIAQTYGRQNPDLALAWARSLPPAQSQAALRSVIMGVASVDPDRAFDLVLANLESGRVNSSLPPELASLSLTSDLSLILTLSTIGSGAQDVDFGRMVDRLASIQNPQVRSMLSQTVGSWSRADPEAALNWAVANVSRLDPSAFAQMAQGLAQQDPARALAMVDRVPPDQRPQWVQGLAQQFAQNDPAQARNLIERYRGQPEYSALYGTVASTMARTDPAAAAALMQEAPAGSSVENRSAVAQIAREWSRRDPAAAADWALGLDQTMQRQALTLVATSWAERDLAAAEGWLMGMSRGASRDTALDGYVQVAARSGRFDARLLDAYSTEQAGQQGVLRVVTQIGRTNQQEARRLIDTYITDENVRRTAQDMLARTGGSGSAVLPSGIVVF